VAIAIQQLFRILANNKIVTVYQNTEEAINH